MLSSTFLAAAAQATNAAETSEAAATAPTFSVDVAPILYGNCATCHRPGESGPFPLLDYRDAASRSKQIVDVTRSRFMPPWLPSPGVVVYRHERGLTDAQIDTLARWSKAGAPEGDPAALPPRPTWSEGWHLGEPDLVVEFPEPYVVAAGGRDSFRNFALPIPVQAAHWVRAVEFRPGNPQVVHHALMRIDRTDATRRRDVADPGPGFGGMDISESELPDGHFLAWTPGHVPFPGDDGLAWRLEPGTDLVVQLHLHPSGKPEPVRPSIGFYFTDRAPTAHAWAILLQSRRIDIPAGVTDYTVEDTFEVPVDLDAFSVYPHAHYLGRDMKGFATLPDGTTRWLVRIENWDFNWQDEYRFREPVRLPAGSVITMRYVYDNSEQNVRNPNSPPQRVVGGDQSTDEMANLMLGVVLADGKDLARLREVQLRKNLEFDPGDWRIRHDLGIALQEQGRLGEAEVQFREAARLDPTSPRAQASLGTLLQLEGKVPEAVDAYRRSLQLDPQQAAVLYNLGHALAGLGRFAEAIDLYRRALRLSPDDPDLHVGLANALAAQGAFEPALTHYDRALQLAPGSAEAHADKGTALAALGQLEEAIAELETARRLDPDSPRFAARLREVQQFKAELDEAYAMYEQSLALMRDAELQYSAGRPDQAVSLAERALALATRAQAVEVIGPIEQRLRFFRGAAGGKP